MLRQLCGVYYRSGVFYVISNSRSDAGCWLNMGSMYKTESVDPADVGQIIVSALDASLTIPHPSDLRAYTKPRLKFLGVKSDSELTRTTETISVGRNGNAIDITRYKRVGSGWDAIKGAAKYENLSVEELGRHAMKALGASDSAGV